MLEKHYSSTALFSAVFFRFVFFVLVFVLFASFASAAFSEEFELGPDSGVKLVSLLFLGDLERDLELESSTTSTGGSASSASGASAGSASAGFRVFKIGKPSDGEFNLVVSFEVSKRVLGIPVSEQFTESFLVSRIKIPRVFFEKDKTSSVNAVAFKQVASRSKPGKALILMYDQTPPLKESEEKTGRLVYFTGSKLEAALKASKSSASDFEKNARIILEFDSDSIETLAAAGIELKPSCSQVLASINTFDGGQFVEFSFSNGLDKNLNSRVNGRLVPISASYWLDGKKNEVVKLVSSFTIPKNLLSFAKEVGSPGFSSFSSCPSTKTSNKNFLLVKSPKSEKKLPELLIVNGIRVNKKTGEIIVNLDPASGFEEVSYSIIGLSLRKMRELKYFSAYSLKDSMELEAKIFKNAGFNSFSEFLNQVAVKKIEDTRVFGKDLKEIVIPSTLCLESKPLESCGRESLFFLLNAFGAYNLRLTVKRFNVKKTFSFPLDLSDLNLPTPEFNVILVKRDTLRKWSSVLPQFGLKPGVSQGEVTLVTSSVSLKHESTRPLNEVVSEESTRAIYFLKGFSNFNSLTTSFEGMLPVSAENPFARKEKPASCDAGECFTIIFWTRKEPSSASKEKEKKEKETPARRVIKSCSLTQEQKDLVVTLKLDAESWPEINATNLPLMLPTQENLLSILKPDGTVVGEVLQSFTVMRTEGGELAARGVLNDFMDLFNPNDVYAVTKFNGVELRKTCEFVGLFQPVERKPVEAFSVKINSFKVTPLDFQDDSKDRIEIVASYAYSGVDVDPNDVSVKLEFFKQGTKAPYFLLLSGSSPSDEENGLKIKWVNKNNGELRVSISGLLLDALKEYVDAIIKDRRVTAVFTVQHQSKTKDYSQQSFVFPRSESPPAIQPLQTPLSAENYFAKNVIKLAKNQLGSPVALKFDNILLLPNGWSIQLINFNLVGETAQLIVRNHEGLLINCLSYNTLLCTTQEQECKNDGDIVNMKIIDIPARDKSVILKVSSAYPERRGKPSVKVVKPIIGEKTVLKFDNVALLPNGWSVQLLSIDVDSQLNIASFTVRNNEGVIEDCDLISSYFSSLHAPLNETVECGKIKLTLLEINPDVGSATVIFEKQGGK